MFAIIIPKRHNEVAILGMFDFNNISIRPFLSLVNNNHCFYKNYNILTLHFVKKNIKR